jgi:hypothetical protein
MLNLSFLSVWFCGFVLGAYGARGTFYFVQVYQACFAGSSLKKRTSCLYTLSYMHRGKEYNIALTLKRGPKKSCIHSATTNTNRDITMLLRSFMGPNNDFHHQSVTPYHLGVDVVRVHLKEGRTITFKGCEEINRILNV